MGHTPFLALELVRLDAVRFRDQSTESKQVCPATRVFLLPVGEEGPVWFHPSGAFAGRLLGEPPIPLGVCYAIFIADVPSLLLFLPIACTSFPSIARNGGEEDNFEQPSRRLVDAEGNPMLGSPKEVARGVGSPPARGIISWDPRLAGGKEPAEKGTA